MNIDPHDASWLQYIPFAAVTMDSQDITRISVQRILEAVIIAGVTAGFSVYATQQVISAKIDMLERSINSCHDQVNQIRSDIYKPMIKSQ